MNAHYGLLGALAVAASLVSAPFHRRHREPAQVTMISPCATDSSYQRLAFWVGDWDVYDSTGTLYARQRVHAAIDECAITAEWTSGGGNKGLGLSAFDVKTHEWKQVYVSNQVPFRSGVTLRTSDPSYTGLGIRFIPLLRPADGNLVQTRVTIMPLSGHRALQEFEDSRDGGKTWQVVFKGEHRVRTDAGAMGDHLSPGSLYQYAALGHVQQTLGAFRVGVGVLTKSSPRSPSGHRA